MLEYKQTSRRMLLDLDKLGRIGVSLYSNKYNLSIINVFFMKNGRFSTRIGSYPLLSYWLRSAQLVSSPLCLSSLLVSSSHLLAPLSPSRILSYPLCSSWLLSSQLNSSLLRFSTLLFAPLHSSPLCSALLRPSPLWGEEKIRSVGFSTLCMYVKKLKTSNTSLLLPMQMNLVVLYG